MAEPREIGVGDHVAINEEPFEDIDLRVSDTQQEELGLTSIFVASLTVGCDVYSMAHAEGSREVTVEHVDSDTYVDDEEWRFSIDRLEIL